MRLIHAKNYDDMSLKAANIIAAQMSLNPKSVLGLATGSTPIGTYRHLVEWYQKGELDFGKAVSINLDEYCGLVRGASPELPPLHAGESVRPYQYPGGQKLPAGRHPDRQHFGVRPV